MPAIKDICEFSAFTAYCLEHNILHIELKKVKKLVSKDIEEIYSCHEKMGDKNDLRLLVTFQGFIPMSDDAMAEAKKQSKKSIQAATAYVVHNFALRMGIKFFMNFYKPKYPIYVSSSKADAIKWLKNQKKSK